MRSIPTKTSLILFTLLFGSVANLKAQTFSWSNANSSQNETGSKVDHSLSGKFYQINSR